MSRKNRRRRGQPVMILFAILTVFLLSSGVVSEAAPEGVLKQAIHWGISADWLDPASTGYTGAAQLPMYLFHDALLKPMPDGTYAPCLAESYEHQPGCEGV